MKRIVVSGSMKFRQEIIEIGEKLKNLYNGDVIIPRECIDINMDKKQASKLHFDEIINRDTDMILVVNGNKGELKNYIGANTFAEIAFAFYFNKKVYLLNDVYEPYREEIDVWNVIP